MFNLAIFEIHSLLCEVSTMCVFQCIAVNTQRKKKILAAGSGVKEESCM